VRICDVYDRLEFLSPAGAGGSSRTSRTESGCDQGLSGDRRRGAQNNLLGTKVNELIALAAAVSLRCDGCIVVHTEAALKAGATREEIAEALGTAIGVNAGAGLVYSTRVMDAVKSKTS
jgi:AhpD family alkylhydroperoxidase